MILGGPFQLGMFCDSAAQTAVLCLLQGRGGNCTELVLSSGSASWTVVFPLLSHVTLALEIAGLKAEVSRAKTCYVRSQRVQGGTACGSSKAVAFSVGQGAGGKNSAALALQRFRITILAGDFLE